MDNNNSNQELKGKASKLVSIATAIYKAIYAVVGLIGGMSMMLICFLLVIATSIFLLIAVALGSITSGDTLDISEMETTANTEITNACQSDVTRVSSYMVEDYVDKSHDASMLVKDYVVEEIGEQAEDLAEPDEGWLSTLASWFGDMSNYGGTNSITHEWNYVGYGESNMIEMHFSKSYDEMAETIYGYAMATISAINNYKDSVETLEKCGEDGCTVEELNQDIELECENTEEGCTIEDVLNALSEEDQATVQEVLSGDSSEDIFYIDTTMTMWESELEWGEFEVQTTKTGSCFTNQEDGGCSEELENSLENFKYTGERESVSGGSSGASSGDVSTGESQTSGWNVYYTYTETETREGVIGDIYVPIYLNVDNFLMDEKEEVIEMMTEDLGMSEDEAWEELNTYIYETFENSMTLCGFEVDYSVLGSSFLIGVGDYGYTGEVINFADANAQQLFKNLSAAQAGNYNNYSVKEYVWGNAKELKSQHKISSDSRQCTTFVHWMFYLVNGYDCGLGNGNEMADNTIALYPDKYKASSTPAPGAIASVDNGTRYGHVLFINAVYDDDGDGNWDRLIASDGNVGDYAGVRILWEWSRSEWDGHFGYNIKYAVPIE